MSGSVETTPPAREPVTVEEARLQCRVSDSSEDATLAGYVLAARQLVEDRIGRALVTQTWTETYDEGWPRPHERGQRGGQRWGYRGHFGRRQILLPLAPVQSVVAVTYFDTTGAQQTLDPSQYRVGTHHLVGVIEEAYGVCWPAVRCQVDTISVQYVVGYPEGRVPETIRQALLLLVAHFYNAKEAVVVTSTRSTVSELPIGVDALLAKANVPWAL